MNNYTPVNKNNNGKRTRIEDVFPIQNGDISLLCDRLPEGTPFFFRGSKLMQILAAFFGLAILLMLQKSGVAFTS